jgi:chorismate dehydratase
MVFGKIDYINLLPFHIFLKKYKMVNALKKACEYKKSYPSSINKKFKKRLVGGAFISSIESRKKGIRTLPLGIVAKKNVKSVLVEKNSTCKADPHSATSNVLAKVLKIEGKVLIGDKALKAYIEEPEKYIDLAQEWHKRYQLPFVFARLSINSHFNIYKKISDSFKNKRIRIPRYILNKYSAERQISPNDINEYLKLITYTIGEKEKRGFKLFVKKSLQLRHNLK